jgi:LPS export ABC transporter protein LptC
MTGNGAFNIPAMVVMVGMFVSCTNDLDRVASIELPAAAPDRITLKAEYLMTDSGRLRNILRSGRIEEWSAAEPARTQLTEGVELSFFDSVGDPGSVLTARRGIILPAEKRMEVFEEVVFINARGERLETEHLVWLQDSLRVTTKKPVRVQRGADVIHGVGLDADQDFSRYTIHRITGELHVADDDTLAP